MEYKCLSDFLFKGENKNINISVSKNSPVNASLSLDGYKHSMVQIIALTIALKMKTVIVNPPIVSDTYVFIAIINELGGTAKIYNKRLFIDASTICNANIPFFLLKLETTIGNVAMPNAELNGVKLVAPKVVKNTSIGLDRKQDMKQAILNAQQSVKKLS